MSTSQPAISPAVAGASEFFITMRPLASIVKYIHVDPNELARSLGFLNHLTFRGQLEAALAQPEIRPDLVALKTDLARMEESYGRLFSQFARAEARVERMVTDRAGFHEDQLFKAEIFANRIHGQITRLLKDLRKVKAELDKAQNQADEPSTIAKKLVSKPQQSAPAPEPPAAARATSPPLSISPATSPASASITDQSTSQPALSLHAVPPTVEELQHLQIKHRDLLNNTPKADRPALLAELVQQLRAKQAQKAAEATPQPSQNGKHAA